MLDTGGAPVVGAEVRLSSDDSERVVEPDRHRALVASRGPEAHRRGTIRARGAAVTEPQVVLRDFVEEDLEPYVAWNEPGQAWHAFDAPYLPHPRVEPAMVERIRDRIVNHRWDTPRSRMVVAEAATGQLIGTVARYWESEETHWLALGIVLYDPTRWGRGLGTEALGVPPGPDRRRPVLRRTRVRGPAGGVGPRPAAPR